MEMYAASDPSPTENISVKLHGIHPSVSKHALELFFWSNGVSFSNINYDRGYGEAQVIFTDEHARRTFLEFAEVVPLKIEGHRIHVSSELPTDYKRKDDLAALNSPVVPKKSHAKPSASQVSEQSLMDLSTMSTVSEPSPTENISVRLQDIHSSVSKQALEFFFLSNRVNISSINYKQGDGEACVVFTDEHARKGFLEFAEVAPLEIHGHHIYVSPLITDYVSSELPQDTKSEDDLKTHNSPVAHKKRNGM